MSLNDFFFVSSDWNVTTDPFSSDQISFDLPAYFGVPFSHPPPSPAPPQPEWQNRSYQYDHNQVFPSEKYAPLIEGLQAAQQQGGGIFFSMNLTTIENTWWGIPAGVEVELTVAYLGRLKQWYILLIWYILSVVVISYVLYFIFINYHAYSLLFGIYFYLSIIFYILTIICSLLSPCLYNLLSIIYNL